jgi:septal ring factor EnvC (AmiA/AmiB activator)
LQAELEETRRQSQEQTAQLNTELQVQKAAFEVQRGAFKAQEKRLAEMMQIMQSLGQATGVPMQLSAPPLPTIATSVSFVLFTLRLCFACMT